MKTLFSIGDVSKIYGLSVQALRHYHKIGLVIPKHIDEQTGYRYYTFDQFQFISRLKYLQSLGLSLEEIKKILSDGNANRLKEILLRIKAEKEHEIAEIKKSIDEIEWTFSYYSFLNQNEFQGMIYKKQIEERYIITSGSNPSDTIEQMDVSLHRITNSERYNQLNYRRQFGYLLDFNSLLQGSFNPLSATLFINELPNLESPNIKTLPAGNYLCYCTRILSADWDVNPIHEFIRKNANLKPHIVIAIEYEDNLREYYNALYEIQICFTAHESD